MKFGKDDVWAFALMAVLAGIVVAITFYGVIMVSEIIEKAFTQ